MTCVVFASRALHFARNCSLENEEQQKMFIPIFRTSIFQKTSSALPCLLKFFHCNFATTVPIRIA